MQTAQTSIDFINGFTINSDACSQSAGAIFSLDPKAETAFSNTYDVKKVLIRQKIYTLDLREDSSKIYSEKVYFGGNPVN